MAIQFQRDYELLELEPSSDWEQASASYRKLVHAWHPDRYAQRPRERVHAQQHFIELTKAFNNLRSFYRKNKRLPFEPIKQSVADAPEPPAHKRVKPADDAVMESSILNKRKPSSNSDKSGRSKSFMWLVPAAATICAGLAVFIVIDMNTNKKSVEEAKRILQNVEPSEFLVDSTKVSEANNRAKFVNGPGTSGKMGDKLAKDLFK